MKGRVLLLATLLLIALGAVAACGDEGDGSGRFGPDIRGEDDLAGIESQVRGGGSRMPAFDGELSDAEISAVAQYVTGL